MQVAATSRIQLVPIQGFRDEVCHSQGGGVGLHRDFQGLAVTDQLIEIGCVTRDLGDRSVADRGAMGRHVHLAEEVAER